MKNSRRISTTNWSSRTWSITKHNLKRSSRASKLISKSKRVGRSTKWGWARWSSGLKWFKKFNKISRTGCPRRWRNHQRMNNYSENLWFRVWSSYSRKRLKSNVWGKIWQLLRKLPKNVKKSSVKCAQSRANYLSIKITVSRIKNLVE